ncbi:MAG: LysR family transcriptional regulator [Pseudomonadota bacterium]
MTSNIGWELYRTFLHVLKEGSLSAAARNLGTTQPTVGRHIAALEEALGAVLFTRSQAGLTPTEVALIIRKHAETIENTVASLERTVSSNGSKISGVVRITASEVVGIEVLPSIITRLRNNYPDLRIELVASNRLQDLLHREADIAIRMVSPKQEQLIARRIGNIELGLYARQEYLTQHGIPQTLHDLANYSIIGYDQTNAFLRNASKTLPDISRTNFSLATDSDLAQLAFIRSGAGIGVCQVLLAKRDHNLSRVLAHAFSMQLDTWITMHEDLRHIPCCKIVFDALAEGLTEYLENN